MQPSAINKGVREHAAVIYEHNLSRSVARADRCAFLFGLLSRHRLQSTRNYRRHQERLIRFLFFFPHFLRLGPIFVSITRSKSKNRHRLLQQLRMFAIADIYRAGKFGSVVDLLNFI